MALDGIQLYLDPQILRLLGLRAIALIILHTQQGRGADGQPLAPYSTTPVAVPAGSLTQRARSTLEGKLSYFRKPHGALWVVVEGGYAALKAATYPGDGIVNMTATGGMLRALTVVGVDSKANLIRIGFSRQEAAETAYWHVVSGAGKSKTVRNWLGLTRGEMEELLTLAATHLQIRA